MIQKINLTGREFFSNRFISFIVFLSISISVAATGMFHIIGNNFNDYINFKFAASIPPNTIKVMPGQRGRRNRAGLTGYSLRKIRKIKGVKRVYPLMLAKIPMQVNIRMYGLNYTTDLLCLGAPYSFISKDITGKKYKRLWRKPDYNNIPVLIPASLLKVYNDGMAGPNMLPKISKKLIIGLPLKIVFGHSSLRTLENFIEKDATLAGFTKRINTLAIVAPLKVVKHFNKKLNFDGSKFEYFYAFIKVRDHKSLMSVSAKIKKMGLSIETEKNVSKEIIKLKKNVNLVINSLMYLIVILSAITISFSSMISTMNRIEYYRILRILGSSKIFITTLIVIKYFMVGFLGSFAGIWFLKYFSVNFTEFINIPFVKVSFKLQDNIIKKYLFFGSIFPVLSTLPALFRLYTKGLNRD